MSEPVYHYLITYFCNDMTGTIAGCSEVSIGRPIDHFEQLVSIKTEIEKDGNGLRDVIIFGYQLLRKE